MYIASTSSTIKIHDFVGRNVVYNYHSTAKPEGLVQSISWCKDGSWVALVPFSGFAEIISVKNQLKFLHTIKDIGDTSCVAFQNNTKKNIALGTKAGQVLIYDIKSRNIKKRFPRSDSAIKHVEFTAKDTHIVASAGSSDVFLYNNATNSLCSTFKFPRADSVCALRTNPIKRNYIIAGSNEGAVIVWDTHTNKKAFYINCHKAPVSAVAFSPINSDLIISTGLDRQFCFYDAIDNKLIANVTVEKNINCVDFSPDGTYFLMGAQNGKIYIYDSRRITEPVSSFEAHKSSIKHLAFQKIGDTDSSICSVTLDNTKETLRPTSSGESNEASVTDSPVVLLAVSHKSSSIITQPSISSNDNDSFMAALGLNYHNSSTEYNKQKRSHLEMSDSSRKMSDGSLPQESSNPAKVLHSKLTIARRQSASTPKYLPVVKSTTPNQSPIPVPNATPTPTLTNKNASTASHEINDGVKEELRNMFKEMKNEMKYDFMNYMQENRQMQLDMTMYLVKEFIKIEENLNNLRSEFFNLHQHGDVLAEENMMLKQRISIMEQEMMVLKNNMNNY